MWYKKGEKETVKVVISKHDFIVFFSMEMNRMTYFMSADIPLAAVNHKFRNNI